MRVRRLVNGDMTFGAGSGNFIVDSAEAVAQNITTRLGLWLGEWFANTAEGMAWLTQVLGKGTQSTRDIAIRRRILGTPNVTGITDYSSTLTGRALSVSGTAQTAFGPAPFGLQLPLTPIAGIAPAILDYTDGLYGDVGGTAPAVDFDFSNPNNSVWIPTQ